MVLGAPLLACSPRTFEAAILRPVPRWAYPLAAPEQA